MSPKSEVRSEITDAQAQQLMTSSVALMKSAQAEFLKNPSTLALQDFRQAANSSIRSADAILRSKSVDPLSTAYDAKELRRDAENKLKMVDIEALSLRSQSTRTPAMDGQIVKLSKEFLSQSSISIPKPDADRVKGLQYFAEARLRQDAHDTVATEIAKLPDFTPGESKFLGNKPIAKVKSAEQLEISKPLAETPEARQQRIAETRRGKEEAAFLNSLEMYNQYRSAASGQSKEAIDEVRQIVLNAYERYTKLGGNKPVYAIVAANARQQGETQIAAGGPKEAPIPEVQTVDGLRQEFNNARAALEKLMGDGTRAVDVDLLTSARERLLKSVAAMTQSKEINISEKSYAQNVADANTPRIDPATGLVNTLYRDIRNAREAPQWAVRSRALNERLGETPKPEEASALDMARLSFNKASRDYSQSVESPQKAQEAVESAIKLVNLPGVQKGEGEYALRVANAALGGITNGDTANALRFELDAARLTLEERAKAEVAAAKPKQKRQG